MANKVYPKWKEAVVQAAANSALTGNMRCALVDLADYTYSDAHQFLSDIPGAAIVADVALPGGVARTFTDGIIDDGDITFPNVTGDPSEALIIYISTGVAGTSRLFLFLDSGVTGLPVTPNGGSINTQWDNGANKIVKL
jgi:hypothetical protein